MAGYFSLAFNLFLLDAGHIEAWSRGRGQDCNSESPSFCFLLSVTFGTRWQSWLKSVSSAHGPVGPGRRGWEEDKRQPLLDTDPPPWRFKIWIGHKVPLTSEFIFINPWRGWEEQRHGSYDNPWISLEGTLEGQLELDSSCDCLLKLPWSSPARAGLFSLSHGISL